MLLDIKPAKVPDPTGSGKKIDDFWEPSKKALDDPNFVTSLKVHLALHFTDNAVLHVVLQTPSRKSWGQCVCMAHKQLHTLLRTLLLLQYTMAHSAIAD